MYSGTITIIFDSLNQEARRIALELSMFCLVDKEGKLSDDTYSLLPPIFGDDFSFELSNIQIINRENENDRIHFKCNEPGDVERVRQTMEEFTYPKESNNWDVKLSIGFTSRNGINSTNLVDFMSKYGIKRHPVIIGSYEERFGTEFIRVLSRNIHESIDIDSLNLAAKEIKVYDKVVDITDGTMFKVNGIIHLSSGTFLIKLDTDLFDKSKWINADNIGENIFLVK